MRTKPPSLLPLFRSEMQVLLLERVLLEAEREWTLEELARRAGAPVSSVHRELGRLVDAGLAARDTQRRPHAYTAASDSPAYAPLRRLLELTVGVPRRLEDALSAVPGIRAAALHGSWATGRVRPDSDLDVVVVTDGDDRAVQKAVRRVGRQVDRPVDLSVLSPQLLDELRETGNPFIAKLLAGPRIDLIGDLGDLDSSLDRREHREDRPGRPHRPRPPHRGEGVPRGRRAR